jgi:hypothetical protein
MNSTNPSLERIPVPWGKRWLEFRVRVLPFCIFGAVLVVAFLLWRHAVVPRDVPNSPRPPADPSDETNQKPSFELDQAPVFPHPMGTVSQFSHPAAQ